MTRQYRKITLDQAIAQGFHGLEAWCVAGTVGHESRCGHWGHMAAVEAKARFGGDTPLDAIPFVCGRCGGRKVDVVPVYNAQKRGDPVG